jgi:peptide/nickel transport system substrate-binding protein
LSRRRFLGAAGAAAGAAGLWAAGCGGNTKGPQLTATGEPTEPSTTAPTAGPTRAPAGKRGETLRYTGFVTSDKVYDPHRTQAGPFYGQQALAFSRLLAYASQIDGTIVPDLATTLPEQPDQQTFIFTLNPGARWQQRSPLDGRRVTAEDVKFSIERQRDGDASFVRKAKWVGVDSVEATDANRVVVKLKAPAANMLGTFADVNSFVLPPELTKDGRTLDLDSQIGSGPFRWVEWSEGSFASVARNQAWHGGDGRPYLDGLTVSQPKDTAGIEGDLRTKKLDAAFVGRPQAEKLKRGIPGLQEATVGTSLFFGMRFFLPQAPYNDVRFRTAVTIALDRQAMLRQFFAGSGDVNPWVSWPIKRWTLPQSELTNMPGFRPGESGRATDIKDARAMLAAYTSEKKLPDDLALFVLDDAETMLHMGSLMRDQLKETLDLHVTVYPVPLGDLVRRLRVGTDAPWAAGPDTGWVDLDDWLYPYFHSAGTQNSFALRDTDLDAMIVAQRTEFDETRRQAIGFDVQRKLLTINAAANFVSERLVALSHPYVKNFPLDASDGYQHRFADCWIDKDDPSFRTR